MTRKVLSSSRRTNSRYTGFSVTVNLCFLHSEKLTRTYRSLCPFLAVVWTYNPHFSTNVIGRTYNTNLPGIGSTRLLPQSFSVTMPLDTTSFSEYFTFIVARRLPRRRQST